MGIRFRRTVRLVPGVRLNFSRSGVSTTIGRRGATMTFGKHGTHLNVGLPGTGLSYRTQISRGPEPRRRPIPTLAPDLPSPGSLTVPALGTAIRSDDAAVLTTPGLNQLKTLINETADQRQQLGSHLAAATRNLNAAKRKLALAQALIIRLFTKDAIPRLALGVQASQHQVDTLEADLDACHVDVDFAMDAATTATWSALRASFEILSGCSCIWDITATARVDQWRERTMATTSIARSPVRFGFASDDVIRCGSPVFQLGNVGGRDLNIFPAFLMLREARGEFGLVELMNVTLELGRSRFVETEGIPADSQQLGVTWHKANKDGSRDRRFAQNHQIPIAEYGELFFRSPTGILEAYLFSSYEKSRQFYAAFKGHVDALRHLVTHEVDPASLAAAAPDTEAIPMPPLPGISTRNHLWLDWSALAALVVGCIWLVTWGSLHRAEVAAFFAPSPHADVADAVSSATSQAATVSIQPQVSSTPIGDAPANARASAPDDTASGDSAAESGNTAVAAATLASLAKTTPENESVLRAAVAQALNSGEPQHWNSGDAGRHGDVSVGAASTNGLETCRRFSYSVVDGEQTYRSPLITACIGESRRWLRRTVPSLPTAPANEAVPF